MRKWSLFIILPALGGVATALSALTKGAWFMNLGIAFEFWNRRKGYARGEGSATPRDGSPHGTLIATTSESTLGSTIAALGSMFPALFTEFLGKTFMFTESEGQLVRDMLVPLRSTAQKVSALTMEFLNRTPEERKELEPVMHELLHEVQKQAKPLITYLHQFPTTRVH